MPGDPLCSLSSVEFQIRALELLIECVDRDKLYAGIKGTQLWAQFGKSDVLMIPAKYYEGVEERLQKDAERLQRRLHEGRAGADKVDKVAAGATYGQRDGLTEAEKQAKKERRQKSVLGDLDIDEDSGVPVGEQLKQALLKNAGRVMDLFREWDQDGDGEITRKEFRGAMVRMGLEVPQPDVDLLFDSWDPSGGGTIDFKELQKALRGEGAAVSWLGLGSGIGSSRRRWGAAVSAVAEEGWG